MFVATVYKFLNFEKSDIKILKDMGFEIHTATNMANEDWLNDDGCLDSLGVVKHQIDFCRFPFSFENIKAYKQLRKLIKENDFSLIHCHTPVAGVITRIANIATRKNKTKVIYTAHGFHFYKEAPFLNWILYFPTEYLMSFFTDVLITINNEDYEFAKNYLHSKCVEYIAGVGIDLNKLKDIKIDKYTKKKELGIPEKCKLILSVGELNKNKNHQIVLKSLAKINNKNIHYAICGAGKLQNELKILGEKLNILSQFHLLGQRKDVPEILKCGDVFVFPSLREGLGLAALEAMASGLPLIVSDNRGSRDYAVNDFNSYVIKTNDIDSYKNSIINLLDNAEIRKKFISNSSKTVEKFSLTKVSEKMKKIYLSSLNRLKE